MDTPASVHPAPFSAADAAVLSRRQLMQKRLRAAATHLVLSCVLALLAFALVYFVWYPGPFWKMSGGQGLFFLVVSVDVVIGPLITLAIFDARKSRRMLRIDLAVVALLQLCALAYGLWTIASARPLFAVYNVDRITVVRAGELRSADLALAEHSEYKTIPWFGPELVATRRANTSEERLAMIDAAVAGRDVALQPKFYIPYAEAAGPILTHCHPLAMLAQKNPAHPEAVASALAAIGRPAAELCYLPVIARDDWVALIDHQSAAVVAYLPFNGF